LSLSGSIAFTVEAYGALSGPGYCDGECWC
jgi:hypothetical protein